MGNILTNPIVVQIVLAVIGGVMSLILAVILWFIRQLIASIKENTDKTKSLELQMVSVIGRLDGVAMVTVEFPKLVTEVKVLSERMNQFKPAHGKA